MSKTNNERNINLQKSAEKYIYPQTQKPQQSLSQNQEQQYDNRISQYKRLQEQQTKKLQQPEYQHIFKRHIKFIFQRDITVFSFILSLNKQFQVDLEVQFSIDFEHSDYLLALELYFDGRNEIIRNQFENLQRKFPKCLQQPNKQIQKLKTYSKEEITDSIIGWIFLKSDVLYLDLFLFTDHEKEIIKQTIELLSKFQVIYKNDRTDLWFLKLKKYQPFGKIKKVQDQERKNFIKNRIKVVYDYIFIGIELRRYEDLKQQLKRLKLKINQEDYGLQINQPVQNISKIYKRIQSPQQVHYFMIKTLGSINSMNLFERIKKINEDKDRNISVQFILRQLGTEITGKEIYQKINLLDFKPEWYKLVSQIQYRLKHKDIFDVDSKFYQQTKSTLINLYGKNQLHRGLLQLQYPNLKTLTQKFIKNSEQFNKQIQQNDMDNKLQKLREIDWSILEGGQGSYIINDQYSQSKYPAFEYFFRVKDYNNLKDHDKYDSLINNIQINNRLKLLKMKKNFNDNKCKQITREFQGKSKFVNRIYHQRNMDIGCLGCSQFFYRNMNIFYDSANQCTIVRFPSVRKLKDYESRIKDEICALMNGRGGVILFDVDLQYMKMLPKGEIMNEKDKEEFEQRIMSYASQIYPSIEKNKFQIEITFVPVVEDPQYSYQKRNTLVQYDGEDAIDRQGQSYFTRNYIPGNYVTRVKICPTNAQNTYYWQDKSNLKTYFLRRYDSRKIKQLKGQEIYSFIKEKFNNYYLPQNTTTEEKLFLKKSPNSFKHNRCKKPDIGLITVGSSSQKKTLPEKDYTQSYNNCTMVISKRKRYLLTLESLLKKFNIQHQSQQKFAKYHFKAQNNTFILHHNNSFDDLLDKTIRNENLTKNMNEGKNCFFFVAITKYLKIMEFQKNPLQQEQYQRIKDWFQIQFPNENFKVWRHIIQTDKDQYYMQTQSKYSTLFVYYFLNHYQFQVLFKNPKNFQTVCRDKQTFTQIYNSDPTQRRLTESNISFKYDNKNDQITFLESIECQ